MITWQDPVALALAALLVTLSWLWRRALIQRGAAPHCTQCTAGEAPAARGAAREQPAKAAPRPRVVAVETLRMGRKRAR